MTKLFMRYRVPGNEVQEFVVCQHNGERVAEFYGENKTIHAINFATHEFPDDTVEFPVEWVR